MNILFNANNAPIKLYRSPLSGHCHRVQLLLSLLELPYETIDLDMKNLAHKQPEYLKISPFGKVPAIDDNGFTLSDSNAILVYLSKQYHNGYNWLPEEAKQAAKVQYWLSVAAGEIAYGPCVVRLVKVFRFSLDYEVARKITESVCAAIEAALANQTFLASENVTLADIACYSYISHMPEGGVSLKPYAAIRNWLTQIESLPHFVGMKRSAIPSS